MKHAQCAVIASADGLAIAGSSNNLEQREKLSAVASSLFELGAVASAESDSGDCMSVSVESTKGKIFVLKLDTRPALTLLLAAGEEALAGEIMFAAKRCGQSIRDLITLKEKLSMEPEKNVVNQ